MLKASIQDIGLLCGYLHDAYFKPEEVAFDSGKNLFTMPLDRVCYERGEPGKALLIFRVIRYPWMRSRLSITGVTEMNTKRKDRGVDGPGSTQQLLEIEVKDAKTIEIESAHLRIALAISEPAEVTLRDEALDTGRRVLDFSKGVFHGLEEIEKLRVKD
jgi:hypothetical protein